MLKQPLIFTLPAVNKHLIKATGAHYNTPGHSVSDMQVSILEKIYNTDPLISSVPPIP